MIFFFRKQGSGNQNNLAPIPFWFLGLFISFLVIWPVGSLFLDTIDSYTWEEKIGKFVYTPGQIIRHRSEGSGLSKIGKYGISSIPDITKIPKRKIAIWGDSYVEARHVDDCEKMAQVFTNLCQSNGYNDLIAFGIGHQGDDIADYYFAMPRYEKIIEGIETHFIIVTNIKDLLPDQDSSRCVFRSKPCYCFVDTNWSPPFNEVKRILSRYELGFLWSLVRNLKELDLQFKPRPNRRQPIIDKSIGLTGYEYEAWSFLLNSLKGQTVQPVVFVYAPHVPRIENGKIAYSNEHSTLVNAFSEVCAKKSVDFINMEQTFSCFYQETGRFPRGFPNSRPGEGHLNADGHLLLAKEIFDYFVTSQQKTCFSPKSNS